MKFKDLFVSILQIVRVSQFCVEELSKVSILSQVITSQYIITSYQVITSKFISVEYETCSWKDQGGFQRLLQDSVIQCGCRNQRAEEKK